MLSLVPFSVRMRKAGLVRDPTVREFSMQPKWVLPQETVAAKQARHLAKVDRVIAVLERFVAKCAAAARWRLSLAAARSVAHRFPAIRRAEKWTAGVWSVNWFVLDQETERAHQLAHIRHVLNGFLEQRIARGRYSTMPEAEWLAVARAKIAEFKSADRDLLPLIRGLLNPVNEERAERAHRLAEQERMWQELQRSQLHNRQRVAPVRVARVVRSRFAALDSDSE